MPAPQTLSRKLATPPTGILSGSSALPPCYRLSLAALVQLPVPLEGTLPSTNNASNGQENNAQKGRINLRRLRRKRSAKEWVGDSLDRQLSLSSQSLRSGGDIYFSIRISWYDPVLCKFFGETWRRTLGQLKREDMIDGDTSNNKSLHVPEYIGVIEKGRVSLNFDDMDVFFYTHISHPKVVIVVEMYADVFDTDAQSITLGWSIIHPFDKKRGGVNIDDVIDHEERFPASPNIFSVEIYTGSPRILPLLPGDKGERQQILLNPLLTVILACSLRLSCSYDPTPRLCTFLFPENTFVSKLDAIPGLYLDQTTSQSWKSISFRSIWVAKARVQMYPNPAQYDDHVLACFVQSYHHHFNIPYEWSNYKQISDIPFTAQFDAKVIERRLYMGIHNSLVFLTPPNDISLRPLMTNDDGVITGYTSSGHLELERFISTTDDRLRIVVWIVYKCMLTPHHDYVDSEKILGRGAKSPRSPGPRSPERTRSARRDPFEQTFIIGWGSYPTVDLKNGDSVCVDMCQHPFPFDLSRMVFHYNPNNINDPIVLKDKSIVSKEQPMRIEFEVYETKPTDFSLTRSVARTPSTKRVASTSPQKRATRTHIPPLRVNIEKPPSPPPLSPTVPPSITHTNLPESQPSPILSSVEPMKTTEELTLASPPLTTVDLQTIHPISTKSSETLLSTPLIFPFLTDAFAQQTSRLNRVERTRLLHAGFTAQLDELGQRPYQLESDNDKKNNVDWESELKDDYTINELFLNLKAVSPLSATAQLPRVVFFSVQVFTRDRQFTDRFLLYTGSLPVDFETNENKESSQKQLSKCYPAVLYPTETHTPTNNTSPGYELSWRLDPEHDSFLKHTTSSLWLPRELIYLAEGNIHIDMYDGESMFLIGGATVPLRASLRRGRPSIMFDSSVDLIGYQGSTDRVVPESIARLHVNVTNIGRCNQIRLTLSSLAKRFEMSTIVSDFRDLLLKARNNKVKTKTTAQLLVDVDREAKLLLNAQIPSPLVEDDEHRRKLDRMNRYLKTQTVFPMSNTDLIAQHKGNELELIERARNRRRPQTIRSAIETQMTVRHSITPTLGRACYFELILSNPYSSESVFQIQSDDSLLRVVTDTEEWTYLRRLHHINPVAVSPDKMCHSIRKGYEVLLNADEQLCIPFVYQSFEVFAQYPIDTNTRSRWFGTNESHATATGKTIVVTVTDHQQRPVMYLNVETVFGLPIVDRVYSFSGAEHDNFRKIVQALVQPATPITFLRGPAGSVSKQRFSARSTEGEILCNIDHQHNDLIDVTFRLRCGQAMDMQSFHLMLFSDPFFLQVHEIWRINVRSLHRLDVHCYLGQTTQATVILRGGPAAQLAQCFTSKPEVVRCRPDTPFTLPAGSLVEISLNITLVELGRKEFLLHIVDMERRQLMRGWVVQCQCDPPRCTKAFEVHMALGKPANKKISFCNPYHRPRRFIVTSSNENMVKVKEPVLDMKARETQHIGLRFAAMSVPAKLNILIFINDEEGHSEECLLIDISY